MKVDYENVNAKYKEIRVCDLYRLDGTIAPGYEEKVKGLNEWDVVEVFKVSEEKHIGFWDIKNRTCGTFVEHKGDKYQITHFESVNGLRYYKAVSYKIIQENAEASHGDGSATPTPEKS